MRIVPKIVTHLRSTVGFINNDPSWCKLIIEFPCYRLGTYQAFHLPQACAEET
jgi:hypothetical protein